MRTYKARNVHKGAGMPKDSNGCNDLIMRYAAGKMIRKMKRKCLARTLMHTHYDMVIDLDSKGSSAEDVFAHLHTRKLELNRNYA